MRTCGDGSQTSVIHNLCPFLVALLPLATQHSSTRLPSPSGGSAAAALCSLSTAGRVSACKRTVVGSVARNRDQDVLTYSRGRARLAAVPTVSLSVCLSVCQAHPSFLCPGLVLVLLLLLPPSPRWRKKKSTAGLRGAICVWPNGKTSACRPAASRQYACTVVRPLFRPPCSEAPPGCSSEQVLPMN